MKLENVLAKLGYIGTQFSDIVTNDKQSYLQSIVVDNESGDIVMDPNAGWIFNNNYINIIIQGHDGTT